MSALDLFRTELRALLGPAPFLRRDLAERALFITDAPRRLPNAPAVCDRLIAAGYEITAEGTLWRIDLSPARQASFLRALPAAPLPRDPALRSLCRSLLARGAYPPEAQPWPLIRLTLLALDAGGLAALPQRLAAPVAVCKRTHAPLPVAAATLIMNAAKEEPPC